MAKIFWTDKRLEALSKTSFTLFQGFLLAAVIGGVFGKISSSWLKILFAISTVAFLLFGIIFADKLKGE